MDADEKGPYINAFQIIGDECRLSEKTIRIAFARKPITLQTANKIYKHWGIPLQAFRIKRDTRGQRKRIENIAALQQQLKEGGDDGRA